VKTWRRQLRVARCPRAGLCGLESVGGEMNGGTPHGAAEMRHLPWRLRAHIADCCSNRACETARGAGMAGVGASASAHQK